MLFLSTPQANVPMEKDPIALAIVLGLLLVFTVYTVCRKAKAKKQAPEVVVEEIPTPQEAPGSAGSLKLHNVEPKTAAMLMAIVADKLQKPLNELRFISIKEVE